jgi:hypothetical protein
VNLKSIVNWPPAADWLRTFIGNRKEGFVFRSAEETAIHQSNFLRRSLHPILKKLGIEKQGYHGFRRFRVTHLESSCVQPALVKYWTGHAKSSDGEAVKSTVTDKYVKMAKDTKFRAEVAERIGLGFELPKVKTVEGVPGVPSPQETEVVVSTRKFRRSLAPRARFELATLRLTAECSTIELPGNRATLFFFIVIQT